MNINILDPSVVMLILQEVEGPQNKKRKELEWEATQCTQGMLKDYVAGRMAVLFPKNAKKMRISDVSISKKVIDKLSKAYSEPPIRTIEEKNPDIQEAFTEIYKDGCFNSQYKEFDSIFNLHRYGLFWLNYDMEEEKFRPLAMRPYEYDLVRDPNTGKVGCVIVNYPDLEITMAQLFAGADISTSDSINQMITESQYDSGAESKIFALWTDTQHVVVVLTKKTVPLSTGGNEVKYSLSYVPIPNNAENVNPLGTLPFVYKQKGSSTDYPIHNQLTEQTINFNILNSDLLTAASMQGFGQAVLTYPQNAQINEIEVGYMSAVKLPQSEEPDAKPTDFKFVNANPDLAGQQQVYMNYLTSVLSEHGINGEQAVSGDAKQFASGLDRLISNADVQWIIKENQDIYQELENEVFDKIKAWNRLLGNNILEPVEEIKIYYPRPTVQISDTEKLNNIKQLLDLRLKTRAQALMMLDPNLTLEQAQKEIAEVDNQAKAALATMQQNMKSLGGNQPPPQDPENPDDENGQTPPPSPKPPLQ